MGIGGRQVRKRERKKNSIEGEIELKGTGS